jgi:GPH family glycoside/pentoside/hexuronide:cation symporter
MAENTKTATTGSTSEPKAIPQIMRKLWGIGEFGESVSQQPGGLYSTFFLTDVLLVSPPILAITTMVSSIAGFVTTPLAALFIDGTKPMKWGKLRSWVLIMPFVMLLVKPFAFFKIGTPTFNAFFILTIGIIQSILYNNAVVALNALVPSMCSTNEEMKTLSANRMFGANLGRMAASYITPLIIMPMLASSLGTSSYIILSVVTSVILIGCYLVAFKMSDGFEGNGKPAASVAERKLTLKEIGKAVMSMPQIIVLVLADVTSTLGTFLLPGLLVYMYRYVVQGGNMMVWMATHSLMVGIAQAAGSYSSRWFMKGIKNTRNLLCIIYLIIAAFIFSTRFFVNNVYMFIAMSALAMLFQGVTNPVEGMMYYDVAVVAREKTGEDATATFIALQQFNAKIAGVIRGIVISVLFNVINYDPTQPVTDVLRNGFTNVYSLTFCIIPICGSILMFLFYKITPERVQAAREAIAAREGRG